MKPMKQLFIGICLLMGAAMTAQNFYVYPQQALEFGDFTVASNGGTVTVTETGQRTASGTVQLLNSNYHPAVFQVSTDSPTPVKVTVEVSKEVLVNEEGTAMIMASEFPADRTYTLQAGKPVEVVVGGALQLNGGVSSPGKFRGAISITVIPNSE